MNIIKMRHSTEPRDRTYVKGYGFLSFSKNIGKNLSNKYSQKIIDTKYGIPKIANLLENTSNNVSKFRTRNWVEINDDSRGIYTNADIKFKSTMLKSNLCDYTDAYIFVKGTITITGAGDNAAARQADERDK